MAYMINNVVLEGRIITELHQSTSQKGTPIVSFTVVQNKKDIKDKTKTKYDSIFIRVMAYNDAAEKALRELEKGRNIVLEGSLNPSFDKDSDKQNSVSIIMRRYIITNRGCERHMDSEPESEGEAKPRVEAEAETFDDDENVPF